MPNPRFSTQDWYCHPANKKNEKEPVGIPPASQIPGLSNLSINDAMAAEDDQTSKRKWIRDTDSKYIKLAKGGGRHDLLTFRDPKPRPDDAKLYPRVDWFDHDHPEDEEDILEQEPEQLHKELYRVLPDWYVHDHREELEIGEESQQVGRRGQQPGLTKKKRNIVAFDSLSTWEREEKERATKNSQRKLPSVKHKKEKKHNKPVQEPAANTRKHAVKLPKIEPGEMHHLLTMGYQRDWFDEQREEKNQLRQDKQDQKKAKEDKRSNQMSQAIQMRQPKYRSKGEDKPLFKLSKFQNIQPRVESFRT